MKINQKNHQFLLLIGVLCIFLTACARDSEDKPNASEPAAPDIPSKYIETMEEYKTSQGDAKMLRIHGDVLVTGVKDEILSDFFVLSFWCDAKSPSGEYSKLLSVEIWKNADNDAVFTDSSSTQFVNFRGMYASVTKLLDDSSIAEAAKAELRENAEAFNYKIIDGKAMADAIKCEYVDDSEITDDVSWQNTWGEAFSDEAAAGTTGEKNALKKAEQYLEYSAFSYQGLIDQLKYKRRPLRRPQKPRS